MSSRVAGRLALVAAIAAVAVFALLTFVPQPVHVLAAILTLPIGACVLSGAATAPRRRTR